MQFFKLKLTIFSRTEMMATTRSMLLLMSLMMFEAVVVGGVSDRAYRFAMAYNGIFDNFRKVANSTREDHIHITVKPVDVPCLRPNLVILDEVDDNGHIEFRELLVISDEKDGVVKLTPLNMTGLNAKSSLDTSLLLNLTKDDLSGDPTCVAEFVETVYGNFFGTWPVCTVSVDGTHPSWGLDFTCDNVSATIPMFIGETRDYRPYTMPRIGDKFPLINPPANFINPCA